MFYPEGEFLKLKVNEEPKLNEVEVEIIDDKDEEKEHSITPMKKRKYDEAFSETKNTISINKKISNEDCENKEERRKVNNFKEICQTNYEKEKEEENNQFCKLRAYMDLKSDDHINENKLKDKDIFINLKKFYHILCKCSKCKEKYSHSRIEFITSSNFLEDWESRTLIEDKLNKQAEEETNENKNLVTDINNINMFESGKIKSLPVEKVFLLIKFF
jgi:hypothetical protein